MKNRIHISTTNLRGKVCLASRGAVASEVAYRLNQPSEGISKMESHSWMKNSLTSDTINQKGVPRAA